MTHLAQINLGRLAHALDDPRLDDFYGGVDILNRIAVQADGFVWKYETGTGGTVKEPIWGDPRIVVNMTVWRDLDSLVHFAFNTLHKRFYLKRADWFVPLGRTGFAMWHIEEGRRPTLDEGLERIQARGRDGDTDFAFGWDAHVARAHAAA